MENKKESNELENQVKQLSEKNHALEKLLQAQNESLGSTKIKAFDMVAREQQRVETHGEFLNALAEKLQCQPSFEAIFEAVSSAPAC